MGFNSGFKGLILFHLRRLWCCDVLFLTALRHVSLLFMEWKPTDVTVLFVYCRISTCFGPTGPSSGELVQLFTQPLVQYLYRSGRVLCVHRYWTNGCVNSCTNSPEDGPVGPKHVEIQQYTNKIVTSVGVHSICWKDARYKKLKMFYNVYLFLVL